MKRALALALLLVACEQRVLVGETPDGGAANETWGELRIGSRTSNVDLLFVVDNSPSMSPVQAELKSRFASLIAVLDDFGQTRPQHYHIGVITTDLGAAQYTLGGGQCHPGGDGGKLQPLGAAADVGCRAPVDANFIDYDQSTGAANLPADQGLAQTFACMASVGDHGCGFEMPLEAAYRALHDPPQENLGFLRGDSILAVVFVTNEDDCSTPPDSDLFDPAKVTEYGPLLSYRCTRFGIVCGDPAQPPPADTATGPLANCRPADGGKLYDIERYKSFFRSVRVTPTDVLLASIAGPPQPFSVSLANPNPTPQGPYEACTASSPCAMVLNRSCIDGFTGDPAVRLAALVGEPPSPTATSVCEASYDPAMRSLAQSVVSAASGYGCLPGSPPDEHDPRCEVDDLTRQPDGSLGATRLPSCLDGDALPCWRVVPFAACASGLQLVIDRGATPSPVSTRGRCVIRTG